MTTAHPPADSSPQSIAAALERTIGGRNVRALLLRVADAERFTDGVGWALAYESAGMAGLLYDHRSDRYGLTPLGREVAEACRPKPWTASGVELGWLIDPEGEAVGQIETHEVAARIAALLTADDLAKAKRFEDSP